MGSVAAPAGDDPAWRLNPLIDLHWRVWEADCVAFESVSGETAVIDALEAAALSCFDEGPCSLSRLLASLSQDLGVDPAEGLSERVATIVQDCLARGWLERLESSG